MSTRNELIPLVNKIGDLFGNGITEASLAIAIKNDRSSLAAIPNQTYITEKAKQVDLLTTNNNVTANATNITTQKARIDSLVAVANASFYQKSTVGTTGALLVVASGATTGQINLASVTPLATGYTAVNGDYVLLVYGVSSGSAELIDSRTGSSGKVYNTLGSAVRAIESAIGITKTDALGVATFDCCSLPNTAGYISTSGSVTNGDPTYVYTKIFRVDENESIDYKLYAPPTVRAITFFDKNIVVLSYIAITDSNNVGSGTTIAPIGTRYCQLSFALTGHTDNYFKTKTYVTDLKNDDKSLIIDYSSLFVNSGFIQIWDGVSTPPDASWSNTGYLNVPLGTIEANMAGNSNIASIAFYDKNKLYISGVGYGTAPTNTNGTYTVSDLIPPINAVYMILSAKINTMITSKYYCKANITLNTINNYVSNTNAKTAIPHIPYISPKYVYTVCNDIIPTLAGHNRNYSASIYLDHFFNGFTEEKDIHFKNGSDKLSLCSPIKITSSDEINPTVLYNEGANILEKTISKVIIGEDIISSPFTVVQRSTLNSLTISKQSRVLCIGDSITYGERATMPDDNFSTNYVFHLMCSEMFKQDNIDAGSGSECLFLGTMLRERVMNYKNINYDIKTHHEGYRGYTLSNFLNGDVPKFWDSVNLKFSINAWLNKYRTMDDNGVRLALGNGTGSLITASNINDIDVCVPTHILIMLGANAGGTAEQYASMVSLIKEEFPNMIIALTVSDSAGTYFPSKHPDCEDDLEIWNDNGDQCTRHGLMYTVMNTLQTQFCTTDYENANVYVLPYYFVQPTIESASLREADTPDTRFELTARNKIIAKYGWWPTTHINGIGHINWAYQLYSWIKYTIAKGL